jgi:hypothetical protein
MNVVKENINPNKTITIELTQLTENTALVLARLNDDKDKIEFLLRSGAK